MNKKVIAIFVVMLLLLPVFCFAQKNTILVNDFENLTTDTKNDFIVKNITSSCIVSLLATGNFNILTVEDAKQIKKQDNILQGNILSVFVDSEKKQAQIEVYYKLLDAKTRSMVFANRVKGESSIKPGYKGGDVPLIQEAVDNLCCKLSLEVAKFLFPKSILGENMKQNEFKINIGSSDGVRVGTEFEVLRDQRIIGIAKAISVDKNTSNIAIISKEKGVTILPSDTVRPIMRTLKDTSGQTKSKTRRIKNVILGTLIAGGAIYLTRDKKDENADIPPSISGLSFNPARPKVEDSVVVICNVYNPNNYELKFDWIVTGGSITGTGQTIVWKMPNIPGEYYITVTVSDVKGRKITRISDAIQVSLLSNSPPTLDLKATPSIVNAGGVAIVVATASDADGDTLSYTWTTTGGTITGTGPQIIYTAPKTRGNYQVTVLVSDGRGGTSIAQVTITVENTSPVVSLSASSISVLPGESSIIYANASDADGDSLTYIWTASGGNIEGEGRQIIWTAPDDDDLDISSYTISVNVSDGKDGVASSTITINVRKTNIANLAGYILDGRTNAPIVDAQIILVDSTNTSKQAVTNINGYFIMSNMAIGNANYSIIKTGYIGISQAITLNRGDNLITTKLSPIETGTITGIVTNAATGVPIENAVVKAGTEYPQGVVLYTTTTNTNLQGQYTLQNAPFAVFPPNQPPQLLTYTITASNICYFEKTVSATSSTPTVGSGGNLTVNIPLKPYSIAIKSPTSGSFKTIPSNTLTSVDIDFSWETQNIQPIKISVIKSDSGITVLEYVWSNDIGASGQKSIALLLNLTSGWYNVKVDILQSGSSLVLCNYTTTEKDAIKVE